MTPQSTPDKPFYMANAQHAHETHHLTHAAFWHTLDARWRCLYHLPNKNTCPGKSTLLVTHRESLICKPPQSGGWAAWLQSSADLAYVHALLKKSTPQEMSHF